MHYGREEKVGRARGEGKGRGGVTREEKGKERSVRNQRKVWRARRERGKGVERLREREKTGKGVGG